jgi:LEM3-like protein
MSRFYVYSLAYPNGDVFYIGKALRSRGSRINEHTSLAQSGEAGRKYDIIRGILANGETVLSNTLFETDDESQAYAEEARFISLFDKGKLVNVSPGGVGRKSAPQAPVKLQVFIPTSLRHEVERLAEEAGQTLTPFVARALAAHVIKTKATDQASHSEQKSP